MGIWGYICTLRRILRLILLGKGFHGFNTKAPMFFAQMNDNPEVSTFLTILNAYIAGETRFESIVKAVMGAAIEVATGKKDVIHVDRQYASTSIHLNACCKDLLIELGGREATSEDFSIVASKIKPQTLVF
jgi:hypothetical protein